MSKVLIACNIPSPHQVPFASCLAELVGEENLRFAAVKPPLIDRKAMGWSMENQYSWMLNGVDNAHDLQEALKWWDDADIVLCGEREVDLIDRRNRNNQITFYMSERWWKPPLGKVRIFHPTFARMALRFRHLASSPFFHYLPIGNYAASDMKWLAEFPGRMWLWGYFVYPSLYEKKVASRDAILKVIYAGRMLSLKRLDTLIKAIAWLKKKAIPVELTLIGDGPRRISLMKLVSRYGLKDDVRFEPSLPMGEVRRRIRNSHIFVLPSNAYEGWGAVVNESMAEGCAIVASLGAGSAVSMLEDNKNSLLFRPGDHLALGENLFRLAKDEQLRLKLIRMAYDTISTLWSPNIAAERFLAVGDALLSNRTPPQYENGPMSSR